jgi:hypothetical protein
MDEISLVDILSTIDVGSSSSSLSSLSSSRVAYLDNNINNKNNNNYNSAARQSNTSQIATILDSLSTAASLINVLEDDGFFISSATTTTARSNSNSTDNTNDNLQQHHHHHHHPNVAELARDGQEWNRSHGQELDRVIVPSSIVSTSSSSIGGAPSEWSFGVQAGGSMEGFNERPPDTAQSSSALHAWDDNCIMNNMMTHVGRQAQQRQQHDDVEACPNNKYQDDLWKLRFAQLLEFREHHGHLVVPHYHPPNQKLSQWVKRFVSPCLNTCTFYHLVILSFSLTQLLFFHLHHHQTTLPVSFETYGTAFDVVGGA